MAQILYVNPDSTNELSRRGVLSLERARYHSLSQKSDIQIIAFGSIPLDLPNVTQIKTTSKLRFYLTLPFLILSHPAKLCRSYRQFFCSAITSFFAKLTKKKTVVSIHGQYELFSKLRHGKIPLSKRLSESITLLFADAFITSSYSLTKYFSKKTKKRVYTNPASQPGIDPQIFSPSKTKRKKTILFVGRISPEKNVPLLLNAFNSFSKTHPEYRLKLVLSKMTNIEEKFFSQLRSKKKIQILQNIQNEKMAELYREAALLILPSVTEGCPHVLLEAIACECPVLATDVGDNHLIVKKAGLLIPPNNLQALTKAIPQALNIKVPKSESDRIRSTYSTEASIKNEIDFLNSFI